MRNKLKITLATLLSGLFGFKAYGQIQESILNRLDDREPELNADEFNRGLHELNKPVLYKDKKMISGAIKFLTDNNLPFAVKSTGLGQTIISIRSTDEILLSTQKWGGSN